MRSELVVVGGANGVGKTTFALQYSSENGIEYLGADHLARVMQTTAGASQQIQAGREFFELLGGYCGRGESVIVESTLAGLGLTQQIVAFRRAGFSVTLLYVFLDDVELCKRRVALRVRKGGHHVPESDIERRYNRSLRNCRHRYMPLADRWQLIYNGQQRPVEVAFCEAGAVVVVDEKLYNRFEEISQ